MPSLGRTYLDAEGREVFVAQGLDGRWGAFRRSPAGGLHRVRSGALPMRGARGEAQADLDIWAARRGLRPAPPKAKAAEEMKHDGRREG